MSFGACICQLFAPDVSFPMILQVPGVVSVYIGNFGPSGPGRVSQKTVTPTILQQHPFLPLPARLPHIPSPPLLLVKGLSPFSHATEAEDEKEELQEADKSSGVSGTLVDVTGVRPIAVEAVATTLKTDETGKVEKTEKS